MPIKMTKPSTFRNVAAIKFHLDIKPRTSNELAELVHLSIRAVNRYLNLLREQNEVRVCGHTTWIRSVLAKPCPIPLYALGDKPDAVYNPLTRAQRSQAEWKQIKADTARLDVKRAKSRAKALKPKQQDELAAFFGRVK